MAASSSGISRRSIARWRHSLSTGDRVAKGMCFFGCASALDTDTAPGDILKYFSDVGHGIIERGAAAAMTSLAHTWSVPLY